MVSRIDDYEWRCGYPRGLGNPAGTGTVLLTAYRQLDQGGTPGTCTAVGVYQVTLKELPGGGAAIVTAFGAGKARCQLGSISTGAPARITVRRNKPNCALVNSDFTLAWTK